MKDRSHLDHTEFRGSGQVQELPPNQVSAPKTEGRLDIHGAIGVLYRGWKNVVQPLELRSQHVVQAEGWEKEWAAGMVGHPPIPSLSPSIHTSASSPWFVCSPLESQH